MEIIYNPVFLKPETGYHPENRKRIECLGKLPITEIPEKSSLLKLVHTKDYIDKVKSGKQLDPETILSKESYRTALAAVSATFLAMKRCGFAVVRPPGHHAYPSHSHGFCIFNNIAIITKYLVEQGKKVLIIDFDGHLGDGTESIFYKTNKVLYWSMHQYPAFPGKGFSDEIGEDQGKGYSINIPLPPSSGDDLYFDSILQILPIIKQFDPDITAISAGFDAHQYDPLLELNLSTKAYYQLGKTIAKNFPKCFAVLEGGYNTETLPQCLNNFLAGFNNKTIVYEDQHTESTIQVRDEYDNRLALLKNMLKGYWKV